MYFSGCTTEDVVKQLSDDQLFYYIPYLIQYDKKLSRRILTSLQYQLNSRPGLAQQVYFLQKFNNFWGDTAINVWRSSKVLENTVTWLDKKLQWSGKQRLKEGLVWKDLDLMDPLGLVKGPVTSIKLSKIYSSHTRPMLLQFNPDNEKDTSLCIFKRGDDSFST